MQREGTSPRQVARMEPSKNPPPQGNPFFPVGLPHHLPAPSSFLPSWPAGPSSPLLFQPMVVGAGQIPSSLALPSDALQAAAAAQALQRGKSPDIAKPSYDSDDDDDSSEGGSRKRGRKDDTDINSGGEEDRTKKRREQIAAASRASRARRKRELEDLRSETRQLKQEREALLGNVKKLQKRVDDLQERPVKIQETSKSPASSKFPNLLVDLSQSLVAVTPLLTVIRDKKCLPTDYVHCSDRLCRLLVEEGIANCRLVQPTSVTTPTEAEVRGLEYPNFAKECCVVSIMRSGDIIANAFQSLIHDIPSGKILIQRQEHLQEKPALLHWSKFPKDIGSRFIFVCDPMLGTGGSICACVKELIKHQVAPRNILFLNVVSCPEGLARLHAEYPEVKVVTCAIDERLNDNCYIVPGLGDFGDRYYHTPHE